MIKKRILAMFLGMIFVALLFSFKTIDSESDKVLVELNLHYDNGTIEIKSFDVKKGIAPDYRSASEEAYTFSALSKNKEIYSFKFDTSKKISMDYIDEEGNLGGEEIVRDEFDFSLRVPYVKGTDRFEIKDNSNKLVLEKNSEDIKYMADRVYKKAVAEKKNTCKTLINNGDQDYRIDVVIIPDNFIDEELEWFDDVALQHIDENDEYEGILSREPLQSNKYKFNFYYINEYNALNCGSSYTCDELKAYELAEQCGAYDEIIVLVNSDSASGWAYIGGHFAVSDAYSQSRPAPAVTSHEFGHSWGYLGDEYLGRYETSRLYTANCDVADTNQACPDWCSGPPIEPDPADQYGCWLATTKEQCEETYFDCAWLDEPHPYFGTQCIYAFRTVNIGTDCIEDTGCWFNCGGTNGWRSVLYDSIMFTIKNSDNVFNIVSINYLNSILDEYPGMIRKYAEAGTV